jgi:hypothetical protein
MEVPMETATTTKTAATPCGNDRVNCRFLSALGAKPKTLCQLHLAWCPDDFTPQPTWTARSIQDQRVFRAGG